MGLDFAIVENGLFVFEGDGIADFLQIFDDGLDFIFFCGGKVLGVGTWIGNVAFS